MAIWQFDLHLVPRSRVSALYANKPEMLRRDAFDATQWWTEQQPPPDFHRVLSDVALPSPSWDPAIYKWGDEEGNRVDVIYDGTRVEEIFARVDVRELDMRFVSGLLDFARYCGAMLVTGGMRLIEADEEQFFVALESSPAAAFISDPAAFLARRSRLRR